MIKDYLCSGMTIDYYVSGSGSKDTRKKIVPRPIIISVWSKSTTQTTLKWIEILLKIYMFWRENAILTHYKPMKPDLNWMASMHPS